MSSIADKRRQFVETWKCCICLELPIKPFQTPCGHCMCCECAVKLPVAAGKRACPVCKSSIAQVMAQPQLAQTLETLAELLWPEVWEFWLELKPVNPFAHQAIFRIVSDFVSRADEDTVSALRLFRFSRRFGHTDVTCRDMYLEPLITTEERGTWDGIGPWLQRVLAKCSDDSAYCFVATSNCAAPFLAQGDAAARLIPLLAQITLDRDKWATCVITAIIILCVLRLVALAGLCQWPLSLRLPP